MDDPAATLRELARVVRPGGTVAMLEFGVPPVRAVRALWELYVRLVLPLAGRLISPGWHEVGRFLGPSIRDFEARLPLERQLELWSKAGLAESCRRDGSASVAAWSSGAGADERRAPAGVLRTRARAAGGTT